jgi:uncharacterized RDD family membrane protein YckC
LSADVISTTSTSLEQALADGASRAVVLDLVDEAVERAAAAGDADALGHLSRRLDAVAAERGGEWKVLAIAATRARAVAKRTAPALPIPAEPTSSVAIAPIAPVPAPGPASTPATAYDAATVDAPTAYAGWWIRALAYVIDLIVLGVGYATLASITAGDAILAAFVYITLPLAYFAGMHAYAGGATVGKLVTRIRVETVDGGPVGLARAVGRALVTTGLWIVSIGGLVDLIVLAADGRKQSLHDKAAGTVVRHTPRQPHAVT